MSKRTENRLRAALVKLLSEYGRDGYDEVCDIVERVQLEAIDEYNRLSAKAINEWLDTNGVPAEDIIAGKVELATVKAKKPGLILLGPDHGCLAERIRDVEHLKQALAEATAEAAE